METTKLACGLSLGKRCSISSYSQTSSWTDLVSAFLNASPDDSRWESHVFSVQFCGKVLPGSRTTETTSLSLVSEGWIPPFPLGVIEIVSLLLWIPWQHEPQYSNATGHERVSRLSVQSSSGESLVAVIAWAVSVEG